MNKRLSVGEWHIIGNGFGDEPSLTVQDKIIRFNQPLDLHQNTYLTIANSKLAALKKEFLVQGCLPKKCFIERLTLNNKKLESELGCKPSLGLLTIKTMLDYGSILHIHNMTLLPSLKRSQDCSNRKALPAAYHNWLGERRLAFAWFYKVEWPNLLLKSQAEVETALVKDFDFNMLSKLPYLPKEDAKQLLNEQSKICWRHLLGQISDTDLNSLESLFYIKRGDRFTPNWWLYDNELSVKVNRLQKTLALVQQHHFFAGKV